MIRKSGLRAVVALVALAWPGAAWALFGLSERQDGGQPGAFLQAAMSARPLALGGAYTGIADDATAPFWNASGLAQIQRYDAVTYFSQLGDDARIGSGALALPTARFGTFSFNYVGLQSGSFRRRDASNRDLGTFENNATAMMLSQGFAVSTRWSAGYSLKSIRESIAGFSDTGYGADIGLLYRPHPLWQAGFAVQNLIRPSLRLRDSSETLPMQMRLGGRFDPVSRVTLALDGAITQDRAPDVSAGVEWRAVDPLALRFGANEREITAGVGISLGGAGLNYAFGFPNGRAVRDELGTSHRFSLHLRFGRNVMAGSYRDLARRREALRRDIVMQDIGVDQVKALRRKMARWNGRLDYETFGQVQAARRSLRTLAFTDPEKSLEAQAYVLHFSGRLRESARLFERLTELRPRNRRWRKHAEIARERVLEHPDPIALAATYDRLAAQDRERLARDIREREKNIRLAAAAAEAQRETAGGAGAARESAVESRGSVEPEPRETPTQVAFLPPALPPPLPPQRQIAPPPERRPAAPPPISPPPVREPEAKPEPEPEPEQGPRQQRPAPVPPPAAPEPAVPTVPVVPPPPAVKPEVAEAQRQFAAGDYVESHILTRRVLERDPDDRAAARQAILTNAVVSAQAVLTDPKATIDMKEIARQVDVSMALFDRARRLNGRKRQDEALMLLDEAIATCPANYLARDLSREINLAMEEEKWRKILGDARGE